MGERSSSEDAEAALAWLQAVCQHGKSRPRDNLFSYFRGTSRKDDLTLPIVALLNACCKAVLPEGARGRSSVDRHKAASYLYYIVAEDVLARLFPREPPSSGTAAALQRFKGLVRGASPPPGCTALLACEEWHLPLIECALQLVQLATSTSPEDSIAADMQHVTGRLQRGNRGVLLWQAAGSFLDSFGPDAPLQLPKGLRASLMHMRALLLDGAVLQTGSVFYQLLAAPPGPASGDDGPGELLAGSTLAHQVVAAYGRQVVEAAHLTGWRVLQQHAGAKGGAGGGAPALPPDFHEQCAWLLDCVVLRHLDVCFGVHASVVVGCSVYLAAKALAPGVLTFAGLAQAMSEALPADRLGSWDDVELCLAPPVRADIRAFYNQRFLPALRPAVHGHLAAHGAHARQAAAAAVKAAPAALRVISTNTAPAPDHAAGKRVPLAPKPSTADSMGSSSNSSVMGQRMQQRPLAEDKENQGVLAFDGGGGHSGAGRAVHAVQMGAGARLRHYR